MPAGASQRAAVGRLRAIHRRMSWAAFERLPRRVGWKYEYYGGKAHVTPAKLLVTFRLRLAPRPEGGRRTIRPVTPADAGALEAPFLRAFCRPPEYADYPWRLYKESAAEYLAGFFGDVRGRWSPASVLAEVGGQVVGAALVKTRKSGPLLDCLFVSPEHGRRGWATTLTARAVENLLGRREKTLRSCVHPANGPSLAWHARFGFEEVPDLWVASHRWRLYAAEAERLRRLKRRRDAALARLTEREAYWYAEVERLRRLEEQDFWAAHPRFD